GRASGRQGLLTLGLELRGRTEAVIRLVRSQQLGGVRRVEMQPLRLPVRTMRTVDVGTLVPVEAQPAQVAGDRGFRLTRRSLGVRVLDPQDEPAALAAREQPVEERGTRIADVQLPGRTRCEPDSHALRTNAMAWAAIASPRPMASTPSLVFPLMLTRSIPTPSAAATRARIASMWSLIFGRSSSTVTSTLPTCRPCAATSATARCSRSRLDTSFHRASVSGKWRPMSPRHAAPRMASVIAWQTTSASE